MRHEPLTNTTELSAEEQELLRYLLEQEGMAGSQQVAPSVDAAEPARYALSFEQQRLWYLEQLNPGSSVYTIAPSLHLRGAVNVDALQHSLHMLVRRHEILRTSFEEHDGIPYQVVYPRGEIPFTVIDLRPLPALLRQQRAEELALEDAQKPFDLHTLPLVRAQLLRLADEEWVFLLTYHHMIFDGWSFGVFFQELSRCYQAYLKHEEPALETLTMQYADYAAWQRRPEQEAVYASQRAYWKKQLEGAPAVLELPKDFPRPVLSHFTGDRLPLSIDATRTNLLRKLARQEGCSLYMVVLAAWLTLLYRYSGQEELVVGTPIANRASASREKLIGFLINTLALRVFTGDNPSFLTLLQRVREVTLDAYEHLDLPFDEVVKLANPSRELGHLPLVQVVFSFQTRMKNQLQLPGVEADFTYRRTLASKFDLQLELIAGADGMEGVLEYSNELFTEKRMQRMRGHLHTLLGAIIQDPQQRLNSLPLLTEAEKQLSLVTWNQTGIDYPQGRALHQWIEEQVERTPEATALVFAGESLTYRQLNSQANQLAHYLQAAGVGPDVLVGVCLYRSLAMPIALLAILKAGGAYVPLDPEYPAERLAFMVTDAGMQLVLSQQACAQLLPDEQVQVMLLDTAEQAWAQASTENLNCQVAADNLAYMIYTSGSTGNPKGAMNTHRGICNRLFWMQEAYHLTQDDRVLQKTPFTFDVSVWEFFWPLLTGACLVVAQPEGHRDPVYLVNLIDEQRITTLHFVPSMLQIFLETPGLERCESLRRVVCSGEALPFEVQKRFFAQFSACPLYNLYGPTEAAIDVTAWTCTAESELESVPIGRPIANITTYILNSSLQPVPVGVPGELYLGGEGLARGYLHQPALTAERFIPHPFSKIGGERLYKTGDLARYLPDGTIDFLGRLDFQVKLRGFRIELGEIEAVLDSHPRVRQSVVTLHEDAHGQKRLVAYFSCAQEAQLAIEDLRAYLQLRVPAYMVPALFIPLAELPLTSNGKVNRKALPAPEPAVDAEAEAAYLRAGLSSTYVAPSNEIERSIVGIWENYLHVNPIGIHDRFDELGGDSLMILQVISRLHEAFLVRLAIRDFLADPTVAHLATLIAQRMEQAFDPEMLEQLLAEIEA